MERYTIKEWRGLRGLTAQKLAEKCGVSQRTVLNWQKNGGNVTMSQAYKLAKDFGCAVEQIIFFTE